MLVKLYKTTNCDSKRTHYANYLPTVGRYVNYTMYVCICLGLLSANSHHIQATEKLMKLTLCVVMCFLSLGLYVHILRTYIIRGSLVSLDVGYLPQTISFINIIFEYPKS